MTSSLPPRPDQSIDPPSTVLAPGGSAGVFKGRLVVISGSSTTGGSGLFVYSPTPAKNNLIYSITAAAGHDSFGNTVLAGATSYSLQAGIYYALNESGSGTPPQISWYVSGTDQTGTYTLLYSLADSVTAFGHGFNMGNIPFTVPPLAWSTPLIASNPAGSPAVAETWHNLGALAIAGWTAGTARYKLLSDSGLVKVEIQNLAPSTQPADGTVIWSAANGLPVTYQPSIVTRVVAWSKNQGTEAAALGFDTDGSIQVFGIGGTTTTRLDCYALLSTL